MIRIRLSLAISSSAFWLSSRLYADQKATACKLASVMQNEETTGWQEQQLPFAGSFADVSFIEPVAQRFLSSFKDEKEREIQRRKNDETNVVLQFGREKVSIFQIHLLLNQESRSWNAGHILVTVFGFILS